MFLWAIYTAVIDNLCFSIVASSRVEKPAGDESGRPQTVPSDPKVH